MVYVDLSFSPNDIAVVSMKIDSGIHNNMVIEREINHNPFHHSLRRSQMLFLSDFNVHRRQTIHQFSSPIERHAFCNKSKE
ncbi:hypothetical protein L6452_24672 [Arctium lappa]|uniref:Uncharacterized protein n=1 Tax=Arctium lappa TaxID=4217 RepID=A0ACB9AA69_ARCLA|nr:hypothetical protein L6452_24672 [Arctium lappa]